MRNNRHILRGDGDIFLIQGKKNFTSTEEGVRGKLERQNKDLEMLGTQKGPEKERLLKIRGKWKEKKWGRKDKEAGTQCSNQRSTENGERRRKLTLHLVGGRDGHEPKNKPGGPLKIAGSCQFGLIKIAKPK